MDTTALRTAIANLPLIEIDDCKYLPLNLATDTVAHVLYPHLSLTQMTDVAIYKEIARTTREVCREMGYDEIVHLHPPAVAFKQDGPYLQEYRPPQSNGNGNDENDDNPNFIIGVTFDEEIHDGRLHNPRMHQWDLAEVSRQHYKIPVLADEELLDLIERACAGDWPNDPKGIWHDIVSLCQMIGRADPATGIRRFSVIIEGLGRQKKWPMEAVITGNDETNAILTIRLGQTQSKPQNAPPTTLHKPLFSPGRVLATPGVTALGIDLMPYLRRHLAGDWGELDDFDRNQNNRALKNGDRLFSAYLLPPDKEGCQDKIWIITEWDRSATTVLLPAEY